MSTYSSFTRGSVPLRLCVRSGREASSHAEQGQGSRPSQGARVRTFLRGQDAALRMEDKEPSLSWGDEDSDTSLQYEVRTKGFMGQGQWDISTTWGQEGISIFLWAEDNGISPPREDKKLSLSYGVRIVRFIKYLKRTIKYLFLRYICHVKSGRKAVSEVHPSCNMRTLSYPL